MTDDARDASICIFDMTGKMLRKLPVTTGMESVTVNGWELGEGLFLYSDGGTLQNAHLTLVPGSRLILRNNGKINMASGISFDAPKGAIVNIENGEIN